MLNAFVIFYDTSTALFLYVFMFCYNVSPYTGSIPSFGEKLDCFHKGALVEQRQNCAAAQDRMTCDLNSFPSGQAALQLRKIYQ